jgi:uncharacterized protein YbaP (TraB family)
MLSKSYTLFTLLFLFAHMAFSQKNPHTVLWKIDGHGLKQPSYLLGTAHTYDGAAFIKAHPRVKQLMDSTTLTIEEIVDTQNPTLDPNQFYYHADTTIRTFLSAAQHDTIIEFYRRKSNNSAELLSRIETMRPQIMHLMYLEVSADTTTPQRSTMDQFILTLASTDGKKAIGLENASDRTASLVGTISDEKSFAQVLKEIREEEQGKTTLITAYAIAYEQMNIDYELDHRIVNDNGGVASRNAAWLKKLPAHLSQQSCFIAVGLDHLKTTAGLITGFRKLGYKVTPLKI